MRLAICASFGQSRSSQSRKIGNIDNTNAIQTAALDLIGTSNAGSASAKIKTKKYPQRACQTVRKYVAMRRTKIGMARPEPARRGEGAPFLGLLMPIQIRVGAINRRYPHQFNQIGFIGDTCTSSPIVLAQLFR